ncbi:MAG: nuclear transport factor 2 family protein [Pyrinomonadaceae bacterium]
MVEDRDFSRLESILADDAVFYSPVVHTPQVGKPHVLPYLAAAFNVFLNPTFKYVRQIVGDRDAVLEFSVEIDGISVNGVDMVKFDEAGLISEFKVMLRPLKGVNIVHEKMAEMLSIQKPR